MENVSDLNIAEQVLEELRSAIQSGELAPGERLIERKIAAQLGVSHIPVREALARLTQERLVVREPRVDVRFVGVVGADDRHPPELAGELPGAVPAHVVVDEHACALGGEGAGARRADAA